MKDKMITFEEGNSPSSGIAAGYVKLKRAEIAELTRERDEARKRIQTDFMSGVAIELEKECDALKAQVDHVDNLRASEAHGHASAIQRLGIANRELSTLRERVKGAEDALISIEEYWNGSEASAVDAAEEMKARASQALAALANGTEGK